MERGPRSRNPAVRLRPGIAERGPDGRAGAIGRDAACAAHVSLESSRAIRVAAIAKGEAVGGFGGGRPRVLCIEVVHLPRDPCGADASKRVMGRTPWRPVVTPSQKEGTPMPMGVTRPSPVTQRASD
jgi:hypothetical protein